MTNTEYQKFQSICAAFNIGIFEKYETIAEGVLNLNYKLYTDKGIYFVKGIRNKKYNSIQLISKVEKYMRDSGIPAITMMMSQDDEPFIEIEGEKFTLYPFIESDRSHTYSIEDYFRMGEILARIHLVSKDSIPQDMILKGVKNNDISKTFETLNIYKEKILSKETQDETDALFLKYLNLKLEILNTMKDSDEIYNHQAHILHGDYHAGNLLIEKNSREIIGICDWEKSELGSRAYEIARSAIFLFEDFIKERDRVKSYFEGYMSVYPISKQELIEGFVFRVKAIVKSKWIENLYYNENDSRANHFIEKDIERIHFFMSVIMGEELSEFFDTFL